MKLPFVKRSEYEDLQKELDVALNRIKKLHQAIKFIDGVRRAWLMKKVGNLRAISTINEFFNQNET
jgi:hypothetical protein|tara:strand:+ start:1185 stop:1382 length:198 start_codon:yes stop_codon:yes gene_type:complete